MATGITIYGAAGTGSVPVEAALKLMGLPFELVEVPMTSVDELTTAVGPINPLKQVPALVLPSGELMTESAAMLIGLADLHPEARLAPAPTDPKRAQFLRWMIFIPASIYALYWIRDEPSRLADDKDAEAVILERTAERIADCWKMMDSQVSPGRYILGDEMSVLDLYVTVLSRWMPRRRRFYEVAPKMAEVVRRIDADPRLTDFWAERFPFEDGWEG
jgi:GST-like protein